MESSKSEIQGLLDRGSYMVVNKSDIPKDTTILKSRVQHSIKTDQDGNTKFKRRLVMQGHKDPDKGSIVTEAPTVLRASIRIILTLIPTLEFEFWSRDVKQAFVQSDFPLVESFS